ncbi:MAG: phage Gp37/Gp68 family protein [Afipia sp.]
MAENTKIEWAHHTFNPWTGCTKVGPGCDHCYAEGWAKRSGQVQWGPGAERRRTSEANWRKPLAWNAEAERLGIRYRVFCASLADVFDNEVPAEWRSDLFDLIARTPHLDWLLVTKRIGNVGRMVEAATCMTTLPGNVWLGATVVNQAEADRDIPKLLATPAAVRFLSMEPLLGPVDLTDICPNRGQMSEDHFSAIFDPDDDTEEDGTPFSYIDWVIVGGESGPGARPMHPHWARDIRDQCAIARVPFLFKQWGEWAPASHGHGGKHGAWNGATFLAGFGDLKTPDNNMTRAGKNACGGRLLDGREHNGYPGGAR